MTRRSSGVFSTWAEAQRHLQQAQLAERRELERLRRAQERDLARSRREQQAAYRQYRDAQAAQRTTELEARVSELEGLLALGCRAPAFRLAAMLRPEHVQAYDPGDLAHPVPMPDPAAFQTQPGWGFSASRRAQAQQEAQARYTQAWQAAQAAEAQRQQRLAAHRAQHDRWAAEQPAEVRRHNAGVTELEAALRTGDAEAAVEFFSAALYASTAWPADLPRRLTASYDRGARQLVLDWELPRFDVVPAAKYVRYMPGVDRDKETARPVTQRRALYRGVLAQCLLLVLHELFAADSFGLLDSVAVNGFVDDHDPVTGRRAQPVLATVAADRAAFAGLHLERVSAVDCLVEGLRGQLSARPDQMAAVRPGRTPQDVGSDVVTHGAGGDAGEPDLYAMDPIDFEGLVADLFRAMGMDAVTTQRSNDGGVDVDALDPAPIRGGRIVVQVKRYRNTVPPTAVRDLFGTVQHRGANKGVLVTTSSFGPSARAFAEGKPLELIAGPELVDLLRRHGLRGRLGDPAQAPAQPVRDAGTRTGSGARNGPAPRTGPDPRTVPDPRRSEPAGHNTLGMTWSGSVPLDVCALVCEGSRVLGDDWFVFYNNPRTPDGAVRTATGSGPDKAAIDVAFEALPARADRLVIVAAVDPEAAPGADLTGFTGACIRLLDGDGQEQGRLDVSDGRPLETALVLGSFRRRANGDWDFVMGGKGYRDGLAQLLGDFGVDAT
ncbi:restriction endonuclease [Streptomyces sp. NPDC101132]|uniref:restriction endonuclease n=1 Tax=Streptomyces sp. NPDC101132 TaxID=3366110 RepID=UPI0037F9EFC9